jgi:hypothetical protein
MTKQEWFKLTLTQLGKLAAQNTHDGVQAALDKALALQQQGKTPAIFYSAFDGFRVLTDNSTHKEEMDLLLSLESKAYNFPLKIER